ncbi:DUF3165 family protein [Streptococcus loxodontisalivarius]|uniref:DUF3165 family protein n=1 Tax=Streptococcus loxodontisalivarius TaxID=1349415 RepID=A0ABS2PSC4_9STRE|nr:DUF3165 family protein [Streptococcus loxodontisalivarius]MBM7642610.1 hypothetical protein [Streptococcus loxodontisalivarius]
MFYLIIIILILLYLIFMAPKTIRSTAGLIGIVALSALLLILGIAALLKVFSLPIEYFLGAAMIVFGYFVVRDVLRLSARPRPENMPELSLSSLYRGVKKLLQSRQKQ